MDKAELDKIWRLATALFPSKGKDEKEQKRVWELTFGDISYDAMRDALIEVSRKQGYFPRNAEIQAELPKKHRPNITREDIERTRKAYEEMVKFAVETNDEEFFAFCNSHKAVKKT